MKSCLRFLVIGLCPPQREFYNPGDRDCVTECPCGTYGDVYRAQCRKGMLLSMLFLLHHCFMILTAASDGLFFNQTKIPSRMLVLNTPNSLIVSIKLLVEKNLTINDSLQFRHNHYFIWNYYFTSTPQLKANFRVDVDGQLLSAEQYVWSIINVMNATECSNGTHTFLFLPVKIYITNITGQLRFYFRSRIYNQWAAYQYTSPVAFTANIRNGS